MKIVSNNLISINRSSIMVHQQIFKIQMLSNLSAILHKKKNLEIPCKMNQFMTILCMTNNFKKLMKKKKKLF